MIFKISHQDIKNNCDKNGLKVIGFYTAFNRGVPWGGMFKKTLKKILIKLLPLDFLIKLFPKPGASGFLAVKQ